MNNIDQKLDEVDHTLTQTQKNINQIKSIFGGLKNRFFGGSSTPVPASTSKDSLQVNKTMTTSKTFAGNTSTANKADLVPITGSDREQEINKNLEEMSMGLSHLTSLAKDFQVELDRQDPLIGRISAKTDVTNSRINNQNAQIRKIK